VLLLVVGWKNLGAIEWTGMAAGPVAIYAIRSMMGAYFTFRIDNLTARLKEQQAERTSTIQKLKDATRYDSTLQLLEKYGGADNKPKKGMKAGEGEDDGGEKKKQAPNAGMPNRTNLTPPPTANIQRPSTAPQHRATPNAQQAAFRTQFPLARVPQEIEATADFAPNAFGPGGPILNQHVMAGSTTAGTTQSHWYDRILDTLLGEDETAPKNRFVLICQQCRMVNGQAPPGTKSLTELGIWRCMACGAANGEMDEGERIVRDVLGQRTEARMTDSDLVDVDMDSGESSDLVDVDKEDTLDPEEKGSAGLTEAAEQTRRRKGKKKN
jgi:hypothetical protein